MKKIILFFRLSGHWFPFQILEKCTSSKNGLVFCLIDLFNKLGHPQAAIKNVITTFYAIQTLGRVIFVAVRGTYIWQLLMSFGREITEINAKDKQRTTKKSFILMQNGENNDYFLYIFLMIVLGANLTGIIFTITPFVISYSHAYYQSTNSLPNETVIQRPLVFDAWYPFDMYNSPSYEMVLAIQALCGFVWINMMSSSDAIFLSILAKVLAEIRLLNLRTNKIQLLSNFRDIETRNKLFMKLLKDWVLHHQRIMKMCREIESTFSGFILMTFLFNGGSLSLLAYNVARFQDTISIISVSGYFCVVSFQLLVMSHYGQKVTDKSLNIKKNIYSIPWWKFSKYVRSTFLIILENTEQPITFTGMGYFNLSMEFLLSVFQAAFSYFIILIQLT
ncbi:Odorant receptor 3 [Ladona fulva]|uniref:Odorant receptor n=1 Tax=Ladona fulva TaxID=123851 RepID=A0A8K0KAH0_LADFU|nr:Odorant receptor 3 [Ladona fulva]